MAEDNVVVELPILSISTLEERQKNIEVELWNWLVEKQDDGCPELFLVGVMEKAKHAMLTIFEEEEE